MNTTEDRMTRTHTLDDLRHEIQKPSCGAEKLAERPIPEALAQLENAESRLYSALDYLSDRLGGVLSPELTDDAKDELGRPHASELHGRLMVDAYRVAGAAERVERLLARLTL